MALPKPAAMYCPHGNQIALGSLNVAAEIAVHESHEVGIPVTALPTEEICWRYNSWIIDDVGASESAEW